MTDSRRGDHLPLITLGSALGAALIVGLAAWLVARAWHRCHRLPPAAIADAVVVARDLRGALHDPAHYAGGEWYQESERDRHEVGYRFERDGQGIVCTRLAEGDVAAAHLSAQAYWVGQLTPYERLDEVSIKPLDLGTVGRCVAARIRVGDEPPSLLAVARRDDDVLSVHLTGFPDLDPAHLATVIDGKLRRPVTQRSP